MFGRKKRAPQPAPEPKRFEIVRPPLGDVSDEEPTQWMQFRRVEAQSLGRLLCTEPEYEQFQDFCEDLMHALGSQIGDIITLEIWHLPAYQRHLERIQGQGHAGEISQRLETISAFYNEITAAKPE